MKNVTRLFVLCLLAVFLPLSLHSQSWKFIIYGDTRTHDDAHRSVLQSMMKNSPDYRFIINVGDVVNRGSESKDWRTWQAAVDEELGGIGQNENPPKYMAAPGNHDRVPGDGDSNWAEYLPGQQRFGNGGRYFVLDYENVRFLVLNSMEPPDGPQRDMLMDAIQNNPKQWLLTIWHHPIFDFGPKKYEEKLHREWGVPLYEHGADIMFMGHAHYYVRSKKLKLNGEINPPVDDVRGIMQIVTGNGGAPPYAVNPNEDNNAYMVEKYTSSRGYTECMISGHKLVLRHVLADGTIFDSLTVTANPKQHIRKGQRGGIVPERPARQFNCGDKESRPRVKSDMSAIAHEIKMTRLGGLHRRP